MGCILSIHQDISAPYMSMDWPKIDRLVKDIAYYQKVVTFGLLFSETAALDLQAKLAYNQKFIVTNLNDLKQAQYIRDVKEDTLIIIFSDSGMFIDKYQKIGDFSYKQVFTKTKAKVVAITSNQELE